MEIANRQTISIVIPIYKAEVHITHLLERINKTKALLSKIDIEIIEAILVCDEPVDNSISVIKETNEACCYKFVHIVELGFNVGQHLATSAGILCARGDWIITMDEDLQHPPEFIPDLLYKAQSECLDLVYGRSTLNATHKNSIYRDFSSKFAKLIISNLTGLNLKTISSFRCIRSQFARNCASSMDKFQYLDILLQFLTSPKRRGVLYFPMYDSRPISSYTLPKLISHFSRLIFSSLVSGRRAFLFLLLPVIGALLVGVVVFISAIQTTTLTSAPGWLSIFAILLLLLLTSIITLAVIAKTSSILMLRAISPPSFFVVNRERDIHWASRLRDLLDR